MSRLGVSTAGQSSKDRVRESRHFLEPISHSDSVVEMRQMHSLAPPLCQPSGRVSTFHLREASSVVVTLASVIP